MKSWVREPAVAGRFYPSDESELHETLDNFFEGAEDEKRVRAKVLVAPHAGYMYSGHIAAAGYARVEIPEVAILLCPNHTGAGPAVSVWASGSWKNPLGEVSVDEALAGQLLSGWEVKADREAQLYEHANEVHLPFLQTLRPDIRIVPVTLGPIRLEQCRELGKILADILRGREDVLIVASTDMSHYVPSVVAKRQDRRALKHVEQVDPDGLYQTVVQEEISMCGFVPTTVALSVARLSAIGKGEVIAYGDSSEKGGDSRSVVGYASAILA